MKSIAYISLGILIIGIWLYSRMVMNEYSGNDIWREATGMFMPHHICLRTNPVIIISSTVGNVITGMAYFAIPILLYSIFNKEKLNKNEKRLVRAFMIFITVCGAGHLIDVVTLWSGEFYLVQSAWLLLMGLVSVYTVILMIIEGTREIKQILRRKKAIEYLEQKQKSLPGDERAVLEKLLKKAELLTDT